LFGLLPIPALEFYLLGYTIGAWAILMGITMWLQMQLNPQQPDPMQQAIFNWMPVMFTFMLGGFASGLVIYWAWSNILSIAQQYYIMKKNNVEIPLMDNLRKTLGPIVNIVQHRK
jgi:YidC/Oxa1 family membrane protein insertase